VFNGYITYSADMMLFDLSYTIYRVLTAYIFAYIYNSLSALFGLMSNLINFKEEDEDYNAIEVNINKVKTN
jgi:hypothetical protein